MPRQRKDIENYDFIFLFAGDIVIELEQKLQTIHEILVQKRIIYQIFYVPSDKQTYLLMAFNDEDVVYRQA